ncbi:DUF2059 domain-containing protein [Primorskyibacter sp. S87]|uniref:DUF2059 domain-containing protein n=1 Tax=Primorskyibacter sp. S87 TaxID=3415126 RepID=UPI003C7A4DA4
MIQAVFPTLPGRFPRLILVVMAVIAICCSPLRAAERDKIQAFLKVTGFDVALDSIAFSAASAPDMLGIDPGVFGSEWTRLTGEVFDPEAMRNLALDILENTLSDEALGHAAGFYASDLGQRLVEAENASHMMEDDALKDREGMALLEQMREDGSDRAALLQRMNAAIDSSGFGLRALQEIQIRFLTAASAVGVIELRIDPDELRATIRENEDELRAALEFSALTGAAYTYQDFPDSDVLAYTEALEDPLMQEVYELLNAVQYEIMGNRFEQLARRMSELQPGTDL